MKTVIYHSIIDPPKITFNIPLSSSSTVCNTTLPVRRQIRAPHKTRYGAHTLQKSAPFSQLVSQSVSEAVVSYSRRRRSDRRH